MVQLKNNCSKGQKGFVIILPPTSLRFHKQLGSKPPIVPKDEDDVDFGKFIRLILQINVEKSLKGDF